MRRRDFVPLLSAAGSSGRVLVDAGFRGGNIVVEEIRGEEVFLHQDLRDTRGDWFYWYFRVRGAQSRRMKFRFTKSRAIGVLGPGVSRDRGATWRWLSEKPVPSRTEFEYVFGAGEEEVRFSFGMPYLEEHLRRFLARHAGNRHLRAETLTKSRKGRAVEELHLGCIESEPRYRVLVTCRHHACEMMASAVAEGIMDGVLAQTDEGAWLRKNVELLAIPFVDKDGVEDGDQGKNRIPHDHKADYRGTSIYPETAALRRLVPRWAAGRPLVSLDLHNPSLLHQAIYTHAFRRENENARRAGRYLKVLEDVQAGPLRFRVQDSVEFAKSKKDTGEAGGEGPAAAAPGFSVDFEFPYAMVRGVEVNTATAAQFGRDVVRALQRYLAEG